VLREHDPMQSVIKSAHRIDLASLPCHLISKQEE